MADPRPLISTLGWEAKSIIASYPNFRAVERFHYTSPNAKVDSVVAEVEGNGIPLIIGGWNRHPRWPRSLFNIDWLKKNGDQNPTVRNVHNWADSQITMDDFIKKLRKTPSYASADEQERLYGKDGDCPAEWTEWLANSGAIPNELLFHGSNDFLKFLPDEAKVQTLMCYMGIGDTFTPFHKDLCASSGQNLMCFSEHSGSAFWFMTKSSAAPQVASYFHQLGQEVDLETHVVTIEELARAPFEVYIAEQQIGDLVLVPPRSCHQVVNKGGITIKTSWSRMSLNGLQTALWHELPIYHRVCRQEIYKVKSSIFHALRHFTRVVEDLPEHDNSESCLISVEHLKQLTCLFDDILVGEFSISRDSMPHVSQPEASHIDNLHCDFCGADIFQSFFECDSCLPASSLGVPADVVPIGDGLVLCPSCYVEGRSCQCEEMQPVQCRHFNHLLDIRDQAIRAIQRVDGDYINTYGYLSEHPLQLLRAQNANIFEAACRLFQKRQTDTKMIRSCRARLPHQVSPPAAVYCKSCHSSKCYTHLLELDSVHSVDAMILSDLHDGDTNWHQYHRNSLQQYQEIQQRVIEDEQRGSRPNALHRLAYLAKTFRTCRAMTLGVTKHGWYDRFVQTISIPIANNPAKTLVGLPDEINGNEPYDSQALDNSSSNNPALLAPSNDDIQITNPHPISVSLPSSEDAEEAQHPSSTSNHDAHLPIVDSMWPSPSPRLDTPRMIDSPPNTSIGTQHDVLEVPCSPLGAKEPPMEIVISSTSVDDSGNLSDLTDLPTEVGSPPRTSSVSILLSPKLDVSGQQFSAEPPFSPLSAAVTSSIVTGSKLKSRIVFDCVEIPQSEWCNRKREKMPPPSRRKRKRITDSRSSNITELCDSDNSMSTTQETSRRSLPKRKKKLSKGSASRLPSSIKCTQPSNVQNHPSPSNNFLANALNETFQLNSSAAPRVPTTPLFTDAIPPVIPPVIKSTDKPYYRHIGVQKNLNFARHTSSQPSGDLSSCIMSLEAENRDLRAQAETYKHECGVYRESLDEINRRYNVGHHHSPSLSGPSTLPAHLPQEPSIHPRWRTRNVPTDDRLQATDPEELDHPPIETLPLLTPSSAESISPSRRRRTPTAPRAFGMRARGDTLDSRLPPQTGHQQHRRRSDPTNWRRQRDIPRRTASPDRGVRLVDGPARPRSTATCEAGVSSTSPTINMDHDQGRRRQSPPRMTL